jgi:hypothetical protein
MNRASTALAFGGAPLEGHKVVRFAFTDEGGISQREPYVVVAGVFVHGDEQLIPLENELMRLIRKHIPKEHWDTFVFHATDIWSGTRFFKDRAEWPLCRRMRILRDLARIPRKLNIPVVHAAMKKSDAKFIARKEGQATPHELSVAHHAAAFAACTLEIELHMRRRFPTEIAQIVAEDNDQVRKMAKDVHESFRFPHTVQGIIDPKKILPLRRIRGSVHFANKEESKPLQLADLCAFLIRGHLGGDHPLNRPLYQRIKTMMLRLPKGEEYSGPRVRVFPPYVVVEPARSS